MDIIIPQIIGSQIPGQNQPFTIMTLKQKKYDLQQIMQKQSQLQEFLQPLHQEFESKHHQ